MDMVSGYSAVRGLVTTYGEGPSTILTFLVKKLAILEGSLVYSTHAVTAGIFI